MKVLYVSPASPHPANFGGSLRAASLLDALESEAEVELLVVADEPGPLAREWLAARGATLWAAAETPARRLRRLAGAALRGRSIPAARFAAGRLPQRLRDFVHRSRPDLVILGETFLAEAAPLLRGLGCRLIVDLPNVESELSRSIARVATSATSRMAFGFLARNTAALERRSLPLADRVWCVSDEDAVWYRRELGLAKVDLVPNTLPPSACLAPPRTDDVVILTALFAYPPNEDAALGLIEVSRELAARGVGHRLLLVGRAPSARMLAEAQALPQVEITGEVPDIEPWMQQSSVFAAPLRSGSGTNFKLLQAMMAGRAVVTTPFGARGLALEHGRHALVVEREGFADAVASLLTDAALRAALADEARRHVLSRFSSSALRAAVSVSLVELAASQAGSRS